MQWLGEKPVSIVRAWNRFYEALAERTAFYGMEFRTDKIYPLPETPCIAVIGSMIFPVQQVIRRLIQSSFDWHNFGKWVPLEGLGYYTKPDEPFFQDWGFDGYALWSRPHQVPQLAHTMSEFIRTASAVLNDAVRYPLPFFDDSIQKGLGINSYLYARSESADVTVSGEYAEIGHADLPDSGSFFLAAAPYILAQRTAAGVCRSTAAGHHWMYRGVGELPRGYYHQLPELCGIGNVRASFKATHMITGYKVLDEIDFGVMESEIDFTAGRSWTNIDFSRADEAVQQVLEYRGTFARCYFSAADKEVMLTEKNFKPLPYKYLE